MSNLLSYLPEENELFFYQGQFYALSELSKRINDSYTIELIKNQLCKLREKIIEIKEIQVSYTTATSTTGL